MTTKETIIEVCDDIISAYDSGEEITADMIAALSAAATALEEQSPCKDRS